MCFKYQTSNLYAWSITPTQSVYYPVEDYSLKGNFEIPIISIILDLWSYTGNHMSSRAIWVAHLGGPLFPRLVVVVIWLDCYNFCAGDVTMIGRRPIQTKTPCILRNWILGQCQWCKNIWASKHQCSWILEKCHSPVVINNLSFSGRLTLQ